jgi:UDP-N-acetylmuramate-alanine ligase
MEELEDVVRVHGHHRVLDALALAWAALNESESLLEVAEGAPSRAPELSLKQRKGLTLMADDYAHRIMVLQNLINGILPSKDDGRVIRGQVLPDIRRKALDLGQVVTDLLGPRI